MSTLEILRDYAKEAESLMTERDRLEQALSVNKAKLGRLTQTTIPQLMVELDIEVLQAGEYRLVRKWVVTGKFPEEGTDERDAAEAELDRAEAGSLLTSDISLHYRRGDIDVARRVRDQIREQLGEKPKLTVGVNTNTLRRFAKECIQEGKMIDLQKLGLDVHFYTEVKKVEK